MMQRVFDWVARSPKVALWTLLIGGFVAGAAVAGGSSDEEITKTVTVRQEASERIPGEKLPTSGKVPNLRGDRVDAARLGLAEEPHRDYLWTLKEEQETHSGPAGLVLRQDPQPGQSLGTGKTIRVVVSKARPKRWTTIKTFEGSGAKKSDEFTIPGETKIRIRYQFSGNTNAILHLASTDGADTDFLLNEIGNFNDVTRVYGKDGSYFLDVDGGTWSIKVQAFKS